MPNEVTLDEQISCTLTGYTKYKHKCWLLVVGVSAQGEISSSQFLSHFPTRCKTIRRTAASCSTKEVMSTFCFVFLLQMNSRFSLFLFESFLVFFSLVVWFSSCLYFCFQLVCTCFRRLMVFTQYFGLGSSQSKKLLTPMWINKYPILC